MRTALAIALAISACSKSSPPDVTVTTADVSNIPFREMISTYALFTIKGAKLGSHPP